MAINTWLAAANNLWGATPGAASANWSLGTVPVSTDQVVIDGSAPGDISMNGDAECASLNCLGFANTLNGNFNTLKTYGDVTLSAGMDTFQLYLSLNGNCILTSWGNSFNRIVHDTTCELTLADNARTTTYRLINNSTLSMSTFRMTFEETDSGPELEFRADGGTTLNDTTSSKIIMNGSSDITLNTSGVGLPNLLITGTGSNNLLTAGAPQCNFQLSLTDLHVSNGATWTLNNAFAVASNCTFTNADFGSNQVLDASDNCINGGGNTNISFTASINTWVGLDDNFWGGTPGAASGNWSLGTVPVYIDNVLITAGAPSDVVLNGNANCKSVNFTGFANTFNGNGQKIRTIGDVTLSAGMTATDVRLSLEADCEVTSNGKEIFRIVDDTSTSSTITLGDDLTVCNMAFDGPDKVIDFDDNTLLMKVINATAPVLNLDTSTSMLYIAGAKIRFELDASVGSAQFAVRGGTVFPPIECENVGATGTISTSVPIGNNTLNTESFTGIGPGLSVSHTNHNVQTVNDYSVTGQTTNITFSNDTYTVVVGGNFLFDGDGGAISGSQLTYGLWNVSGSAVAKDIQVYFVNFSAGTALDATDNCGDLQNNTDVTFGPVTFTGSGGNNTGDPANWDPAYVPYADTDIIFNAASPDAHNAITGRVIDFTGYTNTYEGFINAHGNLTLSFGMTLDLEQGVDFFVDATFICDGVPIGYLEYETNSTLTLGDNAIIGRYGVYPSSDTVLAMGANTLEINIDEDNEDGIYLDGSNQDVTYSAGAKFLLKGPGNFTYVDLGIDQPGFVSPPVEVSGGIFLYLYGQSNMASLLITGGGMYMDNSHYETVGNMTFIDSGFGDFGTDDMSGSTLICGGNLDISGAGIVNNGNLDVTGTATIHDRTVSNMTATGPVDCSDNCIDGGGNDANFLFPVPAVEWDGSEDQLWSTGGNWSTDSQPNSGDNALFTVAAPANVDLDADSDFGTIDFTTFVRTFNFNNWTLNAYGDITMGAGMTAVGPWFTINANSVIDTQGIEIWKINNVGTVKLTLGYDLDVSRIFWNTSGNEFDFGGKQLNLKSVNDEESLLLQFNLGSIISGVIGAGISVDVQAGQDGIIYGANTELPPIVLTGAGDGEINIGRNLRTVSFTMESGSLTFSSAGFITSEDVTFNGGTLLAGSGTNTIGGDFYSAVSMPGGTYNVAGNMLIDGPGTVADSQFDVVGTRIIKNRTVSGCTSTNEVDCTDGCIDGGGNDANFVFPSNTAPTTDAGDDREISLPSTSVVLDGSATDDGLPVSPGALTYLWTQTGGPVSVTFVDASDPLTTVNGLTVAGVYTLNLNADDGELNDDDTMQITVSAAVVSSASHRGFFNLIGH